MHSIASLQEFRLEMGLPVWQFVVGDFLVERRVLLPYQQNTVYLNYRVLSGPGQLRLRVRPSVHFRPHEAPVSMKLDQSFSVTSSDQGCEISYPKIPPLRLRFEADASAIVLDGGKWRDLFYRMEHRRGYEAHGAMWSPGYFKTDLDAAKRPR